MSQSDEPERVRAAGTMAWLHRPGAPRSDGAPFRVPPVLSATYHLAGAPQAGIDGYGRMGNPTWRAVEAVLTEMEGGEAVAFPSGMAAATAALVPFLAPGDRLVLPADGYYTVRAFAEAYLAPIGCTIDLVPTAAYGGADLAGARLVWIETPSNPGLDLCDIAALAEAAHAAGALVVCDNTTMTPLGQRCLDLGADLVVSADTKAMNGHSDVLFGHVAGRDGALVERVRQWRTLAGAIPSAMDAWLVLRGLETVEVRLERMCANARAVAEAARAHPAVAALRHPGLADDPAADIARRQMRLGGSLVSMTFRDEQAAQRFVGALQLAYEATSFGGTHSMAERRARWDGGVDAGLVRFSAGCEPTAALVADVRAALGAV